MLTTVLIRLRTNKTPVEDSIKLEFQEFVIGFLRSLNNGMQNKLQKAGKKQLHFQYTRKKISKIVNIIEK
jgi:hypothetical protein